MRTARFVLPSSLRAGLVLLVALALGGLVLPTTTARAAVPDPVGPGLSIGTFNANLFPWIPHEDEVVETVKASRFDVLGLQGIFSQAAADRITGDATVKQQYPYSYFLPGKQQAQGTTNSAPRTEQENYLNCLIGRGADTQTVVQPVPPVDPTCAFLGVNVAFLSQPAFETLQATMQILPKGQGALQAIPLAAAGNGVKYSSGGLPGQLVLSRYPLTDVTTVDFETYLIRRVNLYATVAGVRIAFVDWPNNAIADIDAGLGPLQTGALQPETAQDLLEHTGGAAGVDVAVGTFNTGAQYQPEAYQLLLNNGYTPVTASDLPTYCPPSHAGLDTCQGEPTRDVDHVLTSPTGRCSAPGTFATTPISRHIGLSAVCAKVGTTSAKADAYRVDQATTLNVAAPGVLANDADRSRTVLLRTPPTQASDFALKADGSFTYTPAPGFSGTDRFSYLTDDGTATPTTVTLTVTRTADLAVSLSLPAGATAGGTVDATLVVRNVGPGTATQVASGLNLPSGLTIARASGGAVTGDRRNVGYLAATLAPGATLTYPVIVTVDRSVRGAKTLTAATASVQTKDPVLRNNAAQATVTVTR
ncbi:Ig-like domain-containing protein [Microlunatus spumicola]|uniref:Ig-like domain-containing protein n=1 Tax=Microlunatus spumicola TaxID=81499 RepID=UPI0031CE6D8B